MAPSRLVTWAMRVGTITLANGRFFMKPQHARAPIAPLTDDHLPQTNILSKEEVWCRYGLRSVTATPFAAP